MTCEDAQIVAKTFAEATKPWAARPWLCMVSGGSDSTALAYLAAALPERDAVALFHANHHLRGEDADGDAAFVAELAQRLGLTLFAVDLALDEAIAAGENVEALARRRRYDAAHEALDEWCRERGCAPSQGVLLAAHTLDDRVENLFMRTLVGTGPGGFRGMVRADGRLVRPLLDLTREQLRHYIESQPAVLVDGRTRLPWCEDATNADRDRLRAFVRHELIPLAETRSPKLRSVLRRTMDLIADEDDYLAAEAAAAADAHLTPLDGKGFRLAPEFGAQPLPIARRVVHRALADLAGPDERIDTRAVEAVLAAFAEGRPISGYKTNIQGDLAVSANKRGVVVEPMATYRARRKRRRINQTTTASQGENHA